MHRRSPGRRVLVLATVTAVSAVAVPVPSASAGTGVSGVRSVPRASALRATGVPLGGTGEAVRFQDRNGTNYAILSRRAAGDDVQLQADHVAVTRRSRTVLRETRDGVLGCEFDVVARFVPRSLRVTDADHDGYGEVGYAYVTSCRSDVSPNTLKVLLLEDGRKYVIRGSTRSEDPSAPAVGAGTPEPAARAWPRGTYRTAERLFRAYQRDVRNARS